MKKRIHKLLSLMLTLILVVGMVPMTSLPAFAAKDVYTTSVTGIEVTGDGYYIDPNTNECHIKNIDAEMISGTSKFEPDNSGFNTIYTNESCTTRLKTEPKLDETYYFNVYVRKADTTNNITNSNSNIKIGGFYGGKVLSTETRDDGFFYCVCSIKYGELTGGVKAVASGVAYDSTEGGYAPVFTTLKAVSTTGKELEHIMVDGKYSHYGAKSGCLYKTNLGTSFSDMLTTEPQEGETYYSYFLLDSIDGNLNIEEDLVDIQIPGYDVEYIASYERDMGFTSLVVYKATKVFSTYVGGVGMKDGDYLAAYASKTQTTKPSGGYAYYNNGTLTLNNYEFEGKGYQYSGIGFYAVIYSKNDLTLELIGNNTLAQTDSNSDMIYVNGAKLTVGGDGKLTGTSRGYALYANKDITINGGTVGVSTYYTSIISSGNVIINGGDITAESEDRAAIYSEYDVTVNGGNVTATGANGAIDCDSFSVAEDLKIQAATTVDGELGEYVDANLDSYKKIVIKTPAIYVGGVGMCDGDYLAVGATATTATQPSGGYAYYKDGKLTLNNYSYEGKGYEYDSVDDYYAIVYAKQDLIVELVGTNTLKQTANDSEALHVSDSSGSLAIDGSGSLNVTSDFIGIYSAGILTVNDGTIVSTGGYAGIYCYTQDIIINGGNVTASGKLGLHARYGSVEIIGGYVTAIGDESAIAFSYAFNAPEDAAIQASTTADGELGEYVSANHDSYKKIVVCVHRPTPVAAKAATCKDTGNKAYYTCECGKWFEDSTATKEITDKNSVVTPKLTTHTYEDGKCKYCGIAQPVYHSVYFCFGDSPIASQDIENGKCPIRPEDPYQEGKSFMGWYTKNGEEYDFETPVTGELYLYAKFGYNVFIWLDENDEYPVAGYTAEEGTIINEPAEPGKENKRFIGWYTDGGKKYDFSKPLTGHVNLYARFECIHNYVGGKCEHCGEAAPVTITAPANVKVSIVASSGKPKITWNKVEGAVKYEVWRATSSTGKGSRMSSPTTTSLTNNSAKAGTKYYYYVLAVDKDGNKSAASKRVNIVCDYAQPVVTITNDAATGKPKLTWNAVEGATSYKIYRATSKSGTYSELKTVTGTSCTDTTAATNKTYYYKVKAYGSVSAATSAYSAVVSKRCVLARPTVTLTNVASSGKIKVTWKKVAGAAKYEVWRATAKNGKYNKVQTVKTLSWTDTNSTAGKTYYYKVKAIHTNTNANSAYSAVKSRMADLKAPVVSITTSSGKPKVSWAGITGAKEYKIYRSTSKTGTYKEVKITTAKYWKDTTAVKGKTYYYKVVAVHKNSGANSAYSNVVYKKCTK